MARAFTKNTSNYMNLGVGTYAPVMNGATTMAFAAWCNATSLTTAATDNGILKFVTNVDLNFFEANVDGSVTPKVLRIGARSISTDTTQFKSATTSFTTGAWHHVGAVIDYGAATITPYMDGVAEGGGSVTFGNATLSTTATGATQSDCLGRRNGVTPPPSTGTQWDGSIAEVAVWKDVVPSAADFAAMALGFSPDQFATSGRIDVFRLQGQVSPETSLISTRVGTITGTVAAADHCRIFRPKRRQFWSIPAAAGGGIVGPFYPAHLDGVSGGSIFKGQRVQ